MTTPIKLSESPIEYKETFTLGYHTGDFKNRIYSWRDRKIGKRKSYSSIKIV